ncbi:MAG: serine/threonine protein kinase [Vulcanimicrobiota bacterium]
MAERFIGRYQVLEEIGRGKASVVFRGQDLEKVRKIAIKTLPPKKGLTEKASFKFLREGLRAARLDHPNIVKIYDVGVDKNIYYIVMEFIEGKTLRKFLKEKGKQEIIKIPELVKIFLSMARAVDYAHDRSILHGNIRPENIMLDKSNNIKIMEFGLDSPEMIQELTGHYRATGSVAYLSPEQLEDGFSDQLSDIYSMGVVFFELLTGQPVYHSIGPGGRGQNFTMTPDPRRANPMIPVDIAHMVSKCIEKEPLERIQHSREIINILENWMGENKVS